MKAERKSINAKVKADTVAERQQALSDGTRRCNLFAGKRGQLHPAMGKTVRVGTRGSALLLGAGDAVLTAAGAAVLKARAAGLSLSALHELGSTAQ